LRLYGILRLYGTLRRRGIHENKTTTANRAINTVRNQKIWVQSYGDLKSALQNGSGKTETAKKSGSRDTMIILSEMKSN
jgi:hypothetical protein